MTADDAIKYLENLKADIGLPKHCELWGYEQAITEIIAMLKPAKPIQFEKKSRITRDKYECGACGSSEIYKEWIFCPWCGKQIDWKTHRMEQHGRATQCRWTG